MDDMRSLSYDQVLAMIERRAWIADVEEHAEDDERARRGERAFFG